MARKIKKSVWLTSLILIYTLVMTFLFAGDWIASGNTTRLILTLAAQLVFIIALYFFLRKREQF